jgi:hypothetical protein
VLGNGSGNARLAVLPIAFLAPTVLARVWRARAAVGLLLASVTVSAASAQAHGRIGLAGAALQRRAGMLASRPTPASCPTGVPVQTITVINQARVRPFALAKVENAVVAQSLQLRAAWGTPCVQFGPGGWMLDLLIGGEAHGVHWGVPSPHAQVWTGGATCIGWSQSFSHEILEMLVDPSTAHYYTHDDIGAQLEVADPVEDHAYMLDGTWVSDFTLPAYFAGATLGVCEAILVAGVQQQQCDGPLIAPPDAPGPYDHMGVLSEAWSGGPSDET